MAFSVSLTGSETAFAFAHENLALLVCDYGGDADANALARRTGFSRHGVISYYALVPLLGN